MTNNLLQIIYKIIIKRLLKIQNFLKIFKIITKTYNSNNITLIIRINKFKIKTLIKINCKILMRMIAKLRIILLMALKRLQKYYWLVFIVKNGL
jgi:hypothetical protein